MFNDQLVDYVEAVVAKYLSAVDADLKKSNQHEIGGLIKAGFKPFLGEPARGEKSIFQAKLVYMTDADEFPVICEDKLTWYGATRSGDPDRRPEYRLYYKSNAVTGLIKESDFFLIAKLRDGSLLLIFTPQGSTVESQLRAVFGIGQVDASFKQGTLSASNLILPIRLLLEEFGVQIPEPTEGADYWLGKLVDEFGGKEFPVTSKFSAYARQSMANDIDVIADPDSALMAWMDHEEYLFRIYERHLVAKRLSLGFGVAGNDVDEFIGYSLSVQNRRKSRVGHAFEGHLETLFKGNDLTFERGRGKNKVTENNSQPDFMFPSFSCYQDVNYPDAKLMMLGAKTTCKDRWRQVLSEANRITKKHLVTLEPAISHSQTDEMVAKELQLVVPKQIHSTYSQDQVHWIQGLKEFIAEVQKCASG